MSIILRNYHSHSSAVRGDEAIELLQRWEIWAKIGISRVAKTSEMRKQFFLVPHVAVAVLVCLSSLFYNKRYPATRIARGHLECEPAAQNDDLRGNFRMAARIHVH